ncbi:N-acyl-D-amino-acid deacylase family protein [Paenarthrobacter nitroguajacolicus]|uniref:N-acyl-D-amino-acid deacylase family protein n=1 Tax=Paenarthrobacter nitroguajacolicus TaxID=211146 RepID=UPI000A589BE5|nr:D-aminoacylase [Paenarthrobacter nitroguajacolicus]
MAVSFIIRGGTVLDGSGKPGVQADIAVSGDRVVKIGEIAEVPGAQELDARGCMVSPGFINVLSHAYITLQQDPRGLSDLYQGVTTQIFGEGASLGPVRASMTSSMSEEILGFGSLPAGVRASWPSLRGFLEQLERKGVGFNVGSFVGAVNLRAAVAGNAKRQLSPSELQEACELLDEELSDGALGVGSALIYPPGSYADTAELIAYSKVLARHDALYISHLRSEGDRLLEGVQELIEISRASGARAEVYHLKAVGQENWSKLPLALDLIEAARSEGLTVTADVYPYAAGGTGLISSIPPRFRIGGITGLRRYLDNTEGREEIRAAFFVEDPDWENLYAASGGAQGVVILSAIPSLGVQPGTSLAAIAQKRGNSDPLHTLMDLLDVEPLTDAAYFMADEDNVRLAFDRPWVSVGSDSDAPSTEELFAGHPVHPRAFGAFARVIGRYSRDEERVSIEEAVRRLTALPAENLRLKDRGSISVGAFADIAVFRLDEIADTATYARPATYATGMRHVLVNGVPALYEGHPTGALNGQALRRN